MTSSPVANGSVEATGIQLGSFLVLDKLLGLRENGSDVGSGRAGREAPQLTGAHQRNLVWL